MAGGISFDARRSGFGRSQARSRVALATKLYRFRLHRYYMMLDFVGAGSPTIIAHNLQSHKPALIRPHTKSSLKMTIKSVKIITIFQPI